MADEAVQAEALKEVMIEWMAKMETRIGAATLAANTALTLSLGLTAMSGEQAREIGIQMLRAAFPGEPGVERIIKGLSQIGTAKKKRSRRQRVTNP